MTTTTRIAWTDETAFAACEGERTTEWAPPTDQMNEDGYHILERGCVSYRIHHNDPNQVAIATIYPAKGRGAIATNGDSLWGDYDAARGSIKIDDSDEVVLVHEATEPVVARLASACADEWAAQAESGDAVVSRAPHETYRDWCAASNLPADGDLEALRTAIRELTGRAPTDGEERAFGEALRSRLYDLTPVRERDE